MKLHESEDFKDAILATAQFMNIPDVFIEKDYWLTFILYRLSNHPNSEKIVFKGGTSLSKAYHLIERFSEDIDLALTKIEGINSSQIKKLINKTAKDLTVTPFKEIDNDKRMSKGSRFRRTAYQYPRLSLAGEFHAASSDLLLEINSFTDPSPILRKKIQSYIGTFFSEKSHDSLSLFKLDSFEIQVLGLERTYAEKLLGMIRHSYLGSQNVREKIRHLYDLARLEDCTEIQVFKSNLPQFKKVVRAVKETDQASSEFSGQWLDAPLHSAPLFTDPDIKNTMREAYQSRSFQSLIWDPAKTPKFDKAWNTLLQLSIQLRELEK